jgi:D-sedoheptulose 7-phosphate isomerase
MQHRVENYFQTLASLLDSSVATDAEGRTSALGTAFEGLIETLRATHDRGNRIFFIGNGGSAGIASHMANDFSKNGQLRAMALNDASSLTCLGNDLGYDQVFAHQLRLHASSGDLLVAVSSSGRSPNILEAVGAAREQGARVLTLSGFAPDNPLRSMGDVNLYVPSREYGFVEVSHLGLIHSILDLHMGWGERTLDVAV